MTFFVSHVKKIKKEVSKEPEFCPLTHNTKNYSTTSTGKGWGDDCIGTVQNMCTAVTNISDRREYDFVSTTNVTLVIFYPTF